MSKASEKTLRSHTNSSSISKNDNLDTKMKSLNDGEYINEHMEKLMERMCEKFMASLDTKMDHKFEKFNQDISMITAKLRGIEKKVQGNEEDIQSLRNTIDQLERKNSLRINGLPENDKENISDTILKFIRHTLEVACKSEEISDVFRIGNPHPKTGSRTILVKFVATSKRNEVYLAKKTLKKSGVTIHEDLTKGKYELYQLAQKKYGYRQVWTMGESLWAIHFVDVFKYVRGDSSKVRARFTDISEVKQRWASLGFGWVTTDGPSFEKASTSEQFPPDFLFGTASSAYQIEGGHDIEGKGENVYDFYTKKTPEKFQNSSNGNEACDSYHKWREDVKLLKGLGVDSYSFSISWSRILPDGYSNNMNGDGLRYYNDLINELIKNDIQPIVSMYHFDLPMPLQELGGWTNPYMAYYFEDYANILFSYFGDRVKYWITLNADCQGYGDDLLPPFLNQPGIANYLCQHVMLLAHAKAYHLYDDKFRILQKGKVGIAMNATWYEAYSNSTADIQAAELCREFKLGSLMNPIFHTDGNYPEVFKERVDNVSHLEGYLQSRLPVLTALEADYIQGTFDFAGLNIFTTGFVENATINFSKRSSAEKDINAVIHTRDSRNKLNSEGMRITPGGVRKLLNWVKDKYDDPEIFITGNGYPDRGQINDVKRIKYLQKQLQAISEAIREDKVNVKGYAVWSFMDSFEWTGGYRDKFGLYHVDFSDPNRKRDAKRSASWYKKVIKERRIVEDL